MGGEDFAEVLKEAPGVLFRVSLGTSRRVTPISATTQGHIQ